MDIPSRATTPVERSHSHRPSCLEAPAPVRGSPRPATAIPGGRRARAEEPLQPWGFAQSVSSTEFTHVSGRSRHRGAGRPKYDTARLRAWFEDVVLGGSDGGRVLFWEFMAALRRCPALQTALCEFAGVRFDEGERRQHARLGVRGPLALSVENRAEALRKERSRAKELFELICGKSSGGSAMDWPAFYGFFLQRGLVLDASAALDQSAWQD